MLILLTFILGFEIIITITTVSDSAMRHDGLK